MGFKYISAKELKELIVSGKIKNYILLDIREYKEYSLNHIKGAINIEVKDFMSMDNLDVFFDRNKPIIIYCDYGASSLYAARKMYRDGYDVMSLAGGFANYNKE